MKYKIETDDKEEHLAALHGIDFYCVLWDLDQWLRSECKYHGKPYHEIREKIIELMEAHGVNFNILS